MDLARIKRVWARPQRVAAGLVAVLVGAVGFLPLFGGPGYEHALATGLIVPSAAAIATALDLSRPRGRDPDEEWHSPLAGVGRGVVSGLALAAVAFVTAILHAVLRVGFCDFRGGAITFGLTAAIGAVLGGVWGACVAEIARGTKRRRTTAIVLAMGLPLASALVSVWRFYSSPMIFAFDPFVGYFSGTLYDTVIDPGLPLLTYRLGSVCTLGAVALFASVLMRADDGALRAMYVGNRPDVLARLLLSATFALASLSVLAYGSELGHWHTSPEIAKELGGVRSGPRCTVIFPQSERPDAADLLLSDCEQEIASVEARLGARGPDRITAFFFRDSAEKKRFMGAADTYIAKPWRKEVYLQVMGYPHPVLGHEIAHVVAGSFGRGPFRIAGEAGGLWPNPGLIEGVAVAASPDDEDLTGMQWARAMMALKILPPMGRIFSVGFLGESAAKSYTLAGTFVRWVMDRYGASAVRAWYAGTSIEEVTHKGWSALDAEFRADVAKLELSPEVEAIAKARFGRPSVFGRTCPHVIDQLRHEADQCRDQNQIDRATELYTAVLERDAHDLPARYGRANLALRYGDAARGRHELLALVDDEATPRNWRDRSEEALADGDLLDAKYAEAEARYQRLAGRTIDEDAARTLEVKALAAVDPHARPAVVALLLGSQHRAADIVVAALELGEWSEATRAPLAGYLIGKNLTQRGWYVLASAYLDRVLEVGAPTARIGRETLRQRAVCACALHDTKAVALLRQKVQAPAGPFGANAGGRRDSVLRLLDRCEPALP